MDDPEDYYSILGCDENASIEVIKKCYHEKALTCHPDKVASDVNCTNSFELINKAWKTLSDPRERQIYNAKLNQQRLCQQSLVFGTFKLGDLTYDSVHNLYTMLCRCGGHFAVDASDITPGDSDISVECDSCSLIIYVIIGN